MSNVDIILLVIILLSALIGLARGLMREVLSLVTWATAIALALIGTPVLATMLIPHVSESWMRNGIAFAGIFLGTLVVGGLVQWALGALVKSTGLSGTDRLLGFVFGGARGVLVCLVGLIALRAFVEQTAWWQSSLIIPELLAFEQALLHALGLIWALFAPGSASGAT
jgi:membrane protein required for colicin V production